MFRFEHESHLYLLLGLVPLCLLLLLGRHLYRRQAMQLGEGSLVSQLTNHDLSRRRKWLLALTLFVFACLIISWSNPQWGAKREKVKTRSSDIFIALDISNSMYCEDVAPSRLDRAKRFALQLTERLRGERIGLILFAGNAYLQMPLTTDYAAAQIFIKSATPALAASQGTAMGEAIRKSQESFRQDNRFHKSLVIISDGEDHDADAIETAGLANDEGLIIFTVGVGTAKGSFIPIQVRGNQDWKRDAEGQPVRTRLNETLMAEVANAGGGEYFYLNGTQDILDAIDKKVDSLEKQEFEERSFTEYESYFQVFLGLGILGFLLQWLLANNIIPKRKSI